MAKAGSLQKSKTYEWEAELDRINIDYYKLKNEYESFKDDFIKQTQMRDSILERYENNNPPLTAKELAIALNRRDSPLVTAQEWEVRDKDHALYVERRDKYDKYMELNERVIWLHEACIKVWEEESSSKDEEASGHVQYPPQNYSPAAAQQPYPQLMPQQYAVMQQNQFGMGNFQQPVVWGQQPQYQQPAIWGQQPQYQHQPPIFYSAGYYPQMQLVGEAYPAGQLYQAPASDSKCVIL